MQPFTVPTPGIYSATATLQFSDGRRLGITASIDQGQIVNSIHHQRVFVPFSNRMEGLPSGRRPWLTIACCVHPALIQGVLNSSPTTWTWV